ncbi:MAG: cobalamin-dependent protein [Bacteroidetes bacterium]|nr:cobalamin-dependent protein [Bacteroidota bacterium]
MSIKKKLISNASELAEQIVQLQYEKQPEIWNKYGERGKKLSVRDAAYHLPFLAEAIETGDKAIFTNYVKWVKKLFQSLKFPDEAMIETLKCTQIIIEKEFSKEQSGIIANYIAAGLEQMKKPVEDVKPYIKASDPLGELALRFNKLLLQGDRLTAGQLIINAVEKGTPVQDIYMHVFQKSQYEVGRLWLDNKITVAKEHFCSAATQQIMSQLYPYIFSTERVGRKLVAASVGGELHEIGIRMVADFFEMNGWDTYYLGANTPTDSILYAIEENKADVVGLSVAIPYQIGLLKKTIEQIREKYNEKIKILIGGYALQGIGHTWKDFKADGYAEDAQKAVVKANNLMVS